MSLVVSDSGPVHYLVLCGVIEVLPRLYDQLVIPSYVIEELSHQSTPAEVRSWVQTLPKWALVQSASEIDSNTRLGLGEREAIALAIELKATQLLVDDRLARRVAVERGLLITGTIGIIEQAADKGLLDLRETLQKLLQTNFRVNPEVIRSALQRHESQRDKPKK